MTGKPDVLQFRGSQRIRHNLATEQQYQFLFYIKKRFDFLKEINPEYSLEGLMLKLKLQYSDHLLQRANSLEKALMLGKMRAGEGDNRGRDGWMALLIQWT